MNSILIIVALSIFGVVGDYCLKMANAADGSINGKWLTLAVLIFGSLTFIWLFVFRHAKLAQIGIIYAITTAICLALLGVFFFGEKLNTSEIVGLMGGMSCILLLSRFM